MIYTSYYSNKNIPSAMVKVSISRHAPRSWTGIELLELAPSEQLLYDVKHEIISISKFCDLFIKEHRGSALKQLLQAMDSYDEDIVLLCYEKPNQFCHRQLIIKLAKEYNIKIKELD